jgi:septal ring factor EnvC (AmiA/AmiB activator)
VRIKFGRKTTMEDKTIYLIAILASNVITWVMTRRKNRAEAKGSELDNVEKAAKIWRELTEGLTKQFNQEIDELRSRNDQLQKKVEEVQRENGNLKDQMKALEDENKKLTSQLKKLNKKSPSCQELN